MRIACFSKDTVLIDVLIKKYGEDDIVSDPDKVALTINSGEKQELQVAIVDLRSFSLPDELDSPLPIIALTTTPNFHEATELLKKNVKGYGNRHMLIENLDQAVRSVATGQIWLPPEIINQLIQKIDSSDSPGQESDILAKLSKREQEVARFVSEGLSNNEIAEKMFVSLRTIKAHMSAILKKTGLRNRLELGLALK